MLADISAKAEAIAITELVTKDLQRLREDQIKTAYVAHRTQATRHPTNDDLNNVTSVLTVTGAYRLNMRQKGGALFPLIGYIENDTTKYHFLDVTAIDAANGWVDIRHRDTAYADVASGPVGSDTVDELVALVFQPRGLTIRSGAKHRLRAFGPKTEIAYARWAPSGSAAQTLTEAHGVRSVARSGAGAWTITLAGACEAMVALIAYVENDTTKYHFAEITATDAAAGTITARHRDVAYASVASGPAASDTVDQIEVLVLRRMAT